MGGGGAVVPGMRLSHEGFQGQQALSSRYPECGLEAPSNSLPGQDTDQPRGEQGLAQSHTAVSGLQLFREPGLQANCTSFLQAGE